MVKRILIVTSFILFLTSCSPAPDVKKVKEENIEDGNYLWDALRKVENDVYLEGRNMMGLNEKEVADSISMMALNINIEPENGEIDLDTWAIKESKEGRKVNIEKTVDAVFGADDNSNIKLVIEIVPPLVSSDTLRNNISIIGSFTTKINNKNIPRMDNIILACSKINYTKIAAGEEFSFNQVVGQRTKKEGYKEAPIIIRTEDGPKDDYGIGGGICQISSTLYNAVEACGLEITERHQHSKSVAYVPKGKDATVVYGSMDFKFRNNKQFPIMIRTIINNNRLTVNILENRNF